MTLPFQLLTGSLKLGDDAGSAVEVGSEITQFALVYTGENIEIPAVLSTGTKGNMPGASTFGLQIGYLVNPSTATSVANVLADAILAGETLYFEGTFKPGIVSPTNPKWAGRFVVTGTKFGGDVASLMSDSQTFPLEAAPVKTTTP